MNGVRRYMPSYRTSLLLSEYIANDRVVHVANSPEFMIYGEDLRIFSIVRAPYEGYPGKANCCNRAQRLTRESGAYRNPEIANEHPEAG